MINNCSKTYIFLFLTIVLGVGVNCMKLKELEIASKTSSPHWEQLCHKGHQYLFSEDALDWNEARATCKLLGGYIVRIEDIHENNCLLKHALNNGYENWWWTSGKLSKLSNTYRTFLSTSLLCASILHFILLKGNPYSNSSNLLHL